MDKRTEKPKAETNNAKVIKQPKEYLFVGIAGTIFFVGIALFFFFAPERMIANYVEGVRLPTFFVFLAISFPYILIIMLQVNWKIEIGKDEFTFRNTFGKKRTYKFKDVKVRQLSRCTRFYYSDKHIVGISYLQQNWDALEKAIQKYKSELKKII